MQKKLFFYNIAFFTIGLLASGLSAATGEAGPERWHFRPLLTRTFAGKVAFGAKVYADPLKDGRDRLEISLLARGAAIAEVSWLRRGFAGSEKLSLAAGVRYSYFRYPYPDYTHPVNSQQIQWFESRMSLILSVTDRLAIKLTPGMDHFDAGDPALTSPVSPSPAGSGRGSVESLSASIEYCRLDSRFYPMKGYRIGFERKEWGFIREDPLFSTHSSRIEGELFLRSGKLLLSFQTRAVIAGRGTPRLLREHIGGERTVRGREFGVFTGTSSILGRTELSIPLNFDELAEIGNPVILVDFSIFADSGAAWDGDDYPGIDSYFSGFGFSFDFIPYIGMILKTGYAWNSSSDGTFYFDAGTMF